MISGNGRKVVAEVNTDGIAGAAPGSIDTPNNLH